MRLLLLARRNPSALLLMVQLAGLLLYPAMEGRIWGRLFLEVFSIIVLALAVFLVRATPGLTWVSITLGLPAVVLSFVATVTGTTELDAYSAPLHALFYFYAAYSLLRYTMADTTVTSDELFATGATFTLVAWGFAYTFQFVQAVSAGAFIAALNPEAARTWMELLYLSFTTLDQYRTLRRRAGHQLGQVGGHVRATGRGGLPRDGGIPDGRPAGPSRRRGRR